MKIDEKLPAPTRGSAPEPRWGSATGPRYRLALHALAMVRPLANPGSAPVPSHLRCIAVLPCEISKFTCRTVRKVIECKKCAKLFIYRKYLLEMSCSPSYVQAD